MMRTIRYIFVLLFAALWTGMLSASAAVIEKTPAKYSAKEIAYARTTSLQLTDSGRLLLCFEARGEKTPTALNLAVSKDEGLHWAIVQTVSDGNAEVTDGILWRGFNHSMNLTYSVSRPEGGHDLMLVSCANPDAELPVWSEPRRIGSGRCSAAPVLLRNGMFILAADRDDTGAVGTYISMDRGQTWMAQATEIRPEEKIQDLKHYPVLMAHRSGKLSLFLSAHGYEWRRVCESVNFGQSWSEDRKFMYGPMAQTFQTMMPDGSWLFVKNGKIDERVLYSQRGIFAYLSEDEGQTWYGGMRLDDRFGAGDPVACAGASGEIYIAWSYHPDAAEACEILFARTSQLEIGKSTLYKAQIPMNKWLALDLNKSAAKAFADKMAVFNRKGWASAPLRVATYNIEYTHPGKKDVVPWPDRLEYVDWFFHEYKLDLVGVQEPWKAQYADLAARMEKGGYDQIVSCTSLTGDSFQNAIFWLRDRLELLDQGVLWFTEIPGQRGGFGGSSSRNCIWGKFRDKKTGKVFFHFNCHYDFTSDEAQVMSSRILLKAVREMTGGYPSILTGDFNAKENTRSMKMLAGAGYLADTMTAVENAENKEYYSMGRYQPREKNDKKGFHIDHLYFTPANSKPLSWKLVLDDHDGIWGSDHLPIVIDWLIAN